MHASPNAHAGLEQSNLVPRLHEFERRRKASDASADNDDLLGFASPAYELHIVRHQREAATRRNGMVQKRSAAKHVEVHSIHLIKLTVEIQCNENSGKRTARPQSASTASVLGNCFP